MESLDQSAQFVDYNKQPIAILGAITANICSAGWELIGHRSFLPNAAQDAYGLGPTTQSGDTHYSKIGTQRKNEV